MFSQLLASRPVRQRSAGGIAASVFAHGALIVGAAYATFVPPRSAEPAEVIADYFPPEAPQPAVPPAAPPAGPQVLAGPAVPSLPLPSLVIPGHLPVADLGLGVPLPAPGDFSGHFATSGPPAPPPILPGDAYLSTQVDVEVAVERGSPLPKYPVTLRSIGVEGEARARFVVDTLGRVELSSVEMVSSTNAAFALAVRDVLPKMRFRPARVGGRAVRQLVEFPVTFRLSR